MKTLIIVISLLITMPLYAAEDGTYDAVVTSDNGSYTVPIEVEDDEVTIIYWPNGGAMHLYGAELDGTEATGTSSDDDREYSVEINESTFEDEVCEDYEECTENE